LLCFVIWRIRQYHNCILCKKVFSNITAVTGYFYHRNKKKPLNSDLILAKKISKRLNINHIQMKFLYSDIKKNLKKIIFASQDWRDYNVHCATLNYFIASKLSKKRKKILVFSGDMMNEFCADYLPEKYEGKFYYNYKKIDKRYYQRFLINSLDSSSREVGIFDYFNIRLFQPYSVMKDFYTQFSKRLFNKDDFKYLVNGSLIPKNFFKNC
jgi:asparagine synthetase B (glutamine-hydrolysing)